MGTKFKTLLHSTPYPLSELAEKRIAIDGMNMLFQILHNPFQKTQDLPYGYYLDRTQRVITHLYGWLQKINHFYKTKFLPIVVFDGKPDTFKRTDYKDHARSFRAATQNYHTAYHQGDLTNARNFALSKSFMFPNCVRESKLLLEAAGIPVIMAPSEAEAQCAFLQQIGMVDYVVSMDYDVVLFGATRVIRNLTFSSRKKIKGKWVATKPHLEIIDMEANYQRLGLTREQLIDASLLLGNDFFPGITHLGPKRVVDALHQYGSLENMCRKHGSLFHQLPGGKYRYIQQLFLSPHVIHPSPKDLQVKPFNRKALEHLLLEDHTLNAAKITKKLDQLEKKYAKFAPLFGTSPQRIDYQPMGFDIHLQRRLDRAKKTTTPSLTEDDFAFHSADSIQVLSRESTKKKPKKRIQTRIAKEYGVLKIKGNKNL